MKLRLLILALFPLVLVLSPQVATAHAVAADPTPSPTGSPTGTPETPDDERPEGPHIAVRLFDESNDDEPIVGVTLTVTDEEGTEVGSGETDEEGRAFIPIPSAGRYTVTLEEDTLPEGIELSSGFSNELEITVILAAATNVQFPIGIEERTETPFSERLITSVTSGVKFGLIVALAALGLSLIFGTTGLTNFAHGELITLGAILTTPSTSDSACR